MSSPGNARTVALFNLMVRMIFCNMTVRISVAPALDLYDRNGIWANPFQSLFPDDVAR